MPMTTAADETEPRRPSDEGFEYRSVHTGAVLGLALGAVSAAMLAVFRSDYQYTLALAPVPLIGLFVSLSAWRAIERDRDLYTGDLMAKVGAGLSAVFLAIGLGYGGFVYATEVPEGYARTSFLAMKPDEGDLVSRKFIPDDFLELVRNGDKIFIKGYIRPDSVRFTKNIRDFLLVRDNQECCFGDPTKVKYFDQIQVRLAPGMTTDFSRRLFRVGGDLEVGPPNPETGAPLTYRLEADYIR